MWSIKNCGLEKHIELEGYIFREVSQFKYVGSIFPQGNQHKTEVSSRVQLAKKECYGLEKILNSRTLSKN